MRVLLIANAVASSYSARRRVVIRKALAADHDLEFAETEHRGHATELAAKASAAGFDLVVVLAGDGTLNEAANGLVGTSTMLAPLPGGSTNVYAQTIGVPTDPVDAASVLLQSLETNSTTRIGVGRVNDRYFLFHCGIGFDAAVIRRVERFDARIKRHAAHPVYVAAAFDTWLRGFDRTTPGFDIDLGDDRIEGVYFAIVHKTSPYTFLGNRPLHVEPSVGLHTPLALTAFRRFDAVTMLGAVGSAMGSGRFLRRHRGIERRTDIDRCVVLGRAPVAHQVDGDALGDASRLVIDYVPDSLTLVTPTTVTDAP